VTDLVSDEELPRAQLWLVRHGETEWSASGRHTSHTDVPLTARGRVLATELRERLAGVEFDLDHRADPRDVTRLDRVER
jgi:probable phosphoglycerate mutase